MRKRRRVELLELEKDPLVKSLDREAQEKDHLPQANQLQKELKNPKNEEIVLKYTSNFIKKVFN
jgi:hypothetical protein